MPKRSNSFQRFVKDLEALLAPEGATVTESAWVVDRGIRRLREVDVLVEVQHGPRTLRVGIECRDHKRKADIEWVDALVGKKTLELDRLVGVAKAGFTTGAMKKAAANGIELIDMKARKVVAWVSSFALLEELVVDQVVNPILTGASALMEEAKPSRAFTVEECKTVRVCDARGGDWTLAAIGDWVASRPEVVATARQKLENRDRDAFWSDVDLVAGMHLAVGEERLPVRSLRLYFEAFRRTDRVRLDHQQYGGAQVAIAEGVLAGPLRTSFHVVLAQNAGQAPKFSLQLEPQESTPANPGLSLQSLDVTVVAEVGELDHVVRQKE